SPVLCTILISFEYKTVDKYCDAYCDFDDDCLVTHSPPGVLNTVTGVVGLAAMIWLYGVVFFFQAEDGIRDSSVTGVQTCALPISRATSSPAKGSSPRQSRHPEPVVSSCGPLLEAWRARWMTACRQHPRVQYR